MLKASLLIATVSAAPSLIAHEWGTYTSCAGSDGVSLAGMQHGEEALPGFVHSRSDTFTKEMFLQSQANVAKKSAKITNRRLLGIDPPALRTRDTPFGCHYCSVLDYEPVAGSPTEVTQKLETPVVYFYSEQPVHVSLNVSFPQGIVTQVYPDTVQNLPPIGQVQATANGLASWEVDVAAQGVVLEVPAVPENDIWVPSRQVEANFVTNSAGENERHVFYRGLGRFDVPVEVSSSETLLKIQNTAPVNADDSALSAVFVLESDGETGGTVTHLGAVQAGRALEASLRPHSQDLSASDGFLTMEEYIKEAGRLLEISLMEAGLFQLEAKAMVNTWAKSYFRSAGLRVLYVVPRSWTDDLLPLSMSPMPAAEDLVRVLVGRVEVLTAAAEQSLLAAVTRLTYKDYDNVQQMMADETEVRDLDRFAEAKLMRVLRLTEDTTVHAAVQGMFAEILSLIHI